MSLIRIIIGVLILNCSQFAFAAESSVEIKKLLSVTFDKPNNPVISDPIAVVGGYAIADWVQGEKGGRALLIKDAAGWRVLACGGVGLVNVENLKSSQIPEKTAQTLVLLLSEKEKMMPAEKLKLIDAFQSRKH